MKLRRFSLVLFLFFAAGAYAAPRVEKNVVYGMYSGLALLMDIHHPENPSFALSIAGFTVSVVIGPEGSTRG